MIVVSTLNSYPYLDFGKALLGTRGYRVASPGLLLLLCRRRRCGRSLGRLLLELLLVRLTRG